MDGNDLQNGEAPQLGERRWLTLGLARALLGINEATLRHWADHGLVRAFRTPGGHRRFSSEDIYALMEGGGRAGGPAAAVSGDSGVLPRIRRRVKGTTRGHAPAWMAGFDRAGHERMRSLGREFLELCTDSIDHPDRREVLTAAAALGTTYGEELAVREVPLNDALQAFMFFRNATIEAIRPTLVKRGATVEGVWLALEQLSRLTDQVLLALTAHYEQAPILLEGPSGQAPSSDGS